MPNISLAGGGLLQYNADFGVLICRECEYAIQKSAIESHLLKHKIYRGDRHDLLSQIATLNLLEPNDVPQPRPGSLPIEALPIFTGFRCTEAGCDHLTISEKRIKRHWSEAHGLGESLPPMSTFTCQVKLQTFFRGTKLRYFEVSPLNAPPPPSAPTTLNTTTATSAAAAAAVTSTTNGARESRRSSSGNTSRRQSDTLLQESIAAQHNVSLSFKNDTNTAPDLDLATMTYLHHFTTVACRTLPGSLHYWQNFVTPQGLRHGWLMHGLLAIAARHLRLLSNDLLSEQLHRERDTRFTSQFMAGMQQMMSGLETGMESTTAEMAVQIQSLLKLSHLSATDFSLLPNSEAPCQPFLLISLMRTCTIPSSMSRSGDQLSSEDPFDGLGGPNQDIMTLHSSTNNTPQQLLHHLHTLPSKMAEALEKPDSAMEVFATMSAIATLADCCAISFASDKTEAAWDGAISWLTKIPDVLHDMLARRDTAALVVLAHWAAVLVKRAERLGCWIVKGLARYVVLQVVGQLSATNPAALCLIERLTAEV